MVDDIKKNKRVGILTFHASHNCGSMLQAFALQKIIDRLGYRSDIINFSNDGQRNLYAIFQKNTSPKNIIKNILFLIHSKRLRENYRNYEFFKTKVLNITKKEYHNSSDLEENKFDYKTL